MSAAKYDLCIIGAGPGGLAALSAVLEPYSVDQLSSGQAERAATALRNVQRQVPKVCVIDPAPWLSTWANRFRALEIEWLRSPATAHPDLFDALSLMEFARRCGREDELFDSGAGCDKEIKSLPEVSSGGWRLPSNALFMDFCSALINRLPHEFYETRVKDVRGSDGSFVVELDKGIELEASAVVLALGAPGPPIVPAVLSGLPGHLAFHAQCEDGARLETLRHGERVLVIGGGLTAVQTAQLAHRRGCQVLLLSRRPLTSRHFDVDVKWFDRRRTQGYLFEFLSLPAEQRLRMIRETRGGGSVPNMYMEDVRARMASGRFDIAVGDAEVLDHDGATVQVRIGGTTRRFEKIVAACGNRPDCTSLPLVANLHRRWPAHINGGLPVLSHDVQWGGLKKFFVIGALAALQIGPDAGNLMGLRRAAHIVTSALDSRGWQRDTSSVLVNIRGNRYAALHDDSESDDSDCNDDIDGDMNLVPFDPCGPPQLAEAPAVGIA